MELQPYLRKRPEFVDHPDWLGTKEHILVNNNNLVIEDGYLSGKYTILVRDLGYVSTVYIGIDVVTTLYTGRKFNDDSITRFNTDDSLRFSGIESPGVATFEIRTSEDNVTWSEWVQYQAGDYLCRYFQIRMTLTRQNVNDSVSCTSLRYHGDLPDIDEYGSDTVVNASEGKQILFTKNFHEEPNVHIEITNGEGIYSKFVNKSEVGFTVKLYNGAGVEKTGNFDWHSHGI